jgi:hypothetical protein
MAIEINCSCGRGLNLRDELAGKHIRCPACAATLQVPGGVEVVEEVAAGPPPLAAGRGRRDALDAEPPPRRPERPKEREKKKKKKGSVFNEYYGGEGNSNPVVAFNEGWLGNMTSGIVGGGLTFLVGVIILTLCIIFFASMYGIVAGIFLITIGLIAMLKGLMDLY